MRTIKRNLTGIALACLMALPAVGWAPAAFANDADVIRRGSCSGATGWKLKLSPEDGAIEVEYEVDQNRNGVKWSVTMKDNGVRFFKGTRTTRAPSGSFEVRKITKDLAGADKIVAVARNLRSGETCKGKATF